MSDRWPEVVAGLGVAGCALTALSLIGRWPSLLSAGLVGIGASYGVQLSLGGDTVDAAAPAVAAGLFLAAELGFWSLERGATRYGRAAVGRRALQLGAGALATGLVGSLVLAAASGVSGGVALEAAGVAAAALTVAAIALLASRSSV